MTEEASSSSGLTLTFEDSEEWREFANKDITQAQTMFIDTILTTLRFQVMMQPFKEDGQKSDQTKKRERAMAKMTIMQNLDRLQGCFLPWNNEQTDANKVYFTRQKGIPLLISFSDGPYPPEVRHIAANCVLAFGGNDTRSRVLYGYGCMNVGMIWASKLDNQYLSFSGFNLLWGFLEFEDVRYKAIEAGLIELIIATLEKEKELPRTPILDRLIAAAVGTIQTCSTAERCVPLMIEKGLATVLMKTLPYDTPTYECLTYYIKTIALGGFMMNIPTKKALIKAGVVKDIESFLSSQHPMTLCKVENRRYYWTFTAPFHHLTLSNIPQVQELGAFCLATLAQKVANRKIMIREGYLDHLVCLSWTATGNTKEYVSLMLTALKGDKEGKELLSNPPPLVEICLHTLRTTLYRVKIPQYVLSTIPTTLADRLQIARKIVK